MSSEQTGQNTKEPTLSGRLQRALRIACGISNEGLIRDA
jgi:hypothetical protein